MSHSPAGSISQPTPLPTIPLSELLPWAMFGGLLIFCLAVRPQTELESASWRKLAYRLGIGAFAVAAIVATWKSLHQ